MITGYHLSHSSKRQYEFVQCRILLKPTLYTRGLQLPLKQDKTTVKPAQ